MVEKSQLGCLCILSYNGIRGGNVLTPFLFLIWFTEKSFGFEYQEGVYNFKHVLTPIENPSDYCMFSTHSYAPDTIIEFNGSLFLETGFIEHTSLGLRELGLNYCMTKHLKSNFSCSFSKRIISFDDWGYDAVVTIPSQKAEGQFLSESSYIITYSPGISFSCIGSDCQEVASFFGDQFKFQCKQKSKSILYKKQK